MKCKYSYSNDDIINSDFYYNPKPTKIFKFSPFSLTEIQYLRGLVATDMIENDYESQGMNAKIAQNTSMYEFTNRILAKLDEFEDELGNIKTYKKEK